MKAGIVHPSGFDVGPGLRPSLRTKDSSGNKCVIPGVEAPGWQGATTENVGNI